MAKKSHLFLNNPEGISKKFARDRGANQKLETKEAMTYQPQKIKLRSCYIAFNNDRLERIANRLLNIPQHIECVEIDFFIIFGDSDQYKTQDSFKKRFGLVPLHLSNFNRTVLFAITDAEKFQKFITLLNEFCNSDVNTQPSGQHYAIITLIYHLKFWSSEAMIGFYQENVVLSLINNTAEIDVEYELIKASLFAYLTQLKQQNQIEDFKTDGDHSIEIKGLGDDVLKSITNNFDILYKVQSLRTVTVKPDNFGTGQLSWDIEISPPNHHQVIAILDNGVRRIAPLKDIILPNGYDLTGNPNPDPCRTNHSHGTVVASLAAVGERLFDTAQNQFVADARILPMKIIENFDGTFNIYDMLEGIKNAAAGGTRIFNLSVCGPGKLYNSDYSVFAYHLDKLAYEYDILIFIAAGNLDEDDILAMQSDEQAQHYNHQYPHHFYGPDALSEVHSCESTNICIPAESFNNVTVGAIAENFREGTQTHLTLSKELPAFYTRKNHRNYLAKINGANFTKNQINRNINKPDIVMPGGDRLEAYAAMQVMGFGEQGNDFFNFDSGTSFASPLAANLAAKILNLYSDLNMQSVKALIINGAERGLNASFLNNHVCNIKNSLSQAVYQRNFDELVQKEKTAISSKISIDHLYRNIVGYGRPNLEKVLYSDDKRVSILLQGSISLDTHKAIPINIPSYLLDGDGTKRLKLKATLCYKIFPVWGNQLGYNPVHISFNFAKSMALNNPELGADILADRKHDFFNQFYTPDILNEPDKDKQSAMKTAARNKQTGVKSKMDSWSEDFFPAVNKPFSNVQKLTLNIAKDEIDKVQNQILLVLRCAAKPVLDNETQAWINQEDEQSFSIVISVEEDCSQFGGTSLYDELINVNTLEPIADLNAGLENIAEANA